MKRQITIFAGIIGALAATTVFPAVAAASSNSAGLTELGNIGSGVDRGLVALGIAAVAITTVGLMIALASEAFAIARTPSIGRQRQRRR